jgi:hypothetical protein
MGGSRCIGQSEQRNKEEEKLPELMQETVHTELEM